MILEVAHLQKDFEDTLREMAELTNCVAMRIIVAASNHEASTEWGEGAQAVSSRKAG